MIDSSKQSSNDQTHLPSSSQSTSTRPLRSSKKRKQAQQQEVIRTESIPGHRGDRDVDELVMFIDGNSSTSSVPFRSTEPQKPRLANKTSSSVVTDSNSNKTATKKKSRKTSKSTSSSFVPDDHENDRVNTNEEKQTTISTESQPKQVEKQETIRSIVSFLVDQVLLRKFSPSSK